MPQDDPPSPYAPARSPWGRQPQPLFRIGPLPKAPDRAPEARTVPLTPAYVAPMPASGRPGILSGSLVPTPPRPTAPEPPVAAAPPPPPPAPEAAVEPVAFAPPPARPGRARAKAASNRRTLLAVGVGGLVIAGVSAVVMLAARQGSVAAVRAPAPAPAAAAVNPTPVVATLDPPARRDPTAVLAASPVRAATVRRGAPAPAAIIPPPLTPPPVAPEPVATVAAAPAAAPIVAPPPPDPEAAMSTRTTDDR